MSEENKALYRRVIEESMNKRNMTLMDELLDPGYVYHGVVEGDIKGVEAMKQFLTSLYAAFPDAQHMIEEQIAEGDKVVTRFKSTGTPQVEFMGIAPSGKQVTVDEVTISRIAGGRIVEDWNTWDVLGLFRQLGAAPQATGANKALFRRVCEEEDKGNINILDEVCAPDYAMHFAGNPKPLTRDEHKQIARAFYAAFPDIRHNIEDLIAVDDKVVARMTYPGTHRGEWQGIAPTGKHVAYDAVVIARITGGKIVEMWALLDLLGLMQQLGAAPQSTEANKALACRFGDDFLNKRNWALADEILADDFVLHMPQLPEIRSSEAMKQLHMGIQASFPDVRFTFEEPIAEGDKVVVRWTGAGTHEGEWVGVAPTGKIVRWGGIAILRIAGGKIAEEWCDWDGLSFFQQLGVLPPLGKGEEKAAA